MSLEHNHKNSHSNSLGLSRLGNLLNQIDIFDYLNSSRTYIEKVHRHQDS
jgi:hypothetical protein